MLIRIENQPLSYAWGSHDALPNLLGVEPTGQPQAELWLGIHPASPAKISTSRDRESTLTELVLGEPGSGAAQQSGLPFLFKVLAIGSPLSLQVHPSLDQAKLGFDLEEQDRVALDAPHRNYRDRNHKPELLVALTPVEAFAGFQPAESSHSLLVALSRVVDAECRTVLETAAGLCLHDPETGRRAIIEWAFDEGSPVRSAMVSLGAALAERDFVDEVSPLRLRSLQRLNETYPGDPGILISLLLHVIHLEPGEATYLPPGQLHSYQDGLAVEVMASSDNVLRAGFTPKHVDVDELTKITDFTELASPRFAHVQVAPGVVSWQPDLPDFCLYRANLASEVPPVPAAEDMMSTAQDARIPVAGSAVAFVTQGSVRFERMVDGALGIAKLGRGQGLYAGPGEDIKLQGDGEVYIATVGALASQ